MEIIKLSNIEKDYEIRRGIFNRKVVNKALKGVSFTLQEGETLSIVGESGSGKSTVAKIITGIERPSVGSVKYKGERIDNLDEKAFGKYRTKIQMIFQNPFASLNPKMLIGDLLREAPMWHNIYEKEELTHQIKNLLNECSLDESILKAYSTELSGGQLQRVSIVRALLLKPELIVADEVVSALDVSVQAQILKLLDYLKGEKNLSLIFISHDLSVVRKISDKVIVFRKGEIVEENSTKELFIHPKYEYTKDLINSIPKFKY